MGENALTREDLIEHFLIMWTELGRQPGPGDILHNNLFSSWERFLDALGLAPTGWEEEPEPERGYMLSPPVPLAAWGRGGLPAPLSPPSQEDAPGVAPHGARSRRGRPLPMPSGAGWGVDDDRGYGVAAFSRLRERLVGARSRTRAAGRGRRTAPGMCAALLLCMCLALPLAGPSSCGRDHLPGDDGGVATAEPTQAPYVVAVGVGRGKASPLVGLQERLFGDGLPVVEEVLAVGDEAPAEETPPAGVVATPAMGAVPAEAAVVPAEVATPAPPSEAAVATIAAKEVPKAVEPGEGLIPGEKVTAEVEATEKNKLPTNKQDFILAVTEGSVFSASFPEPSGEAGVRRQILNVAADLLGRAYALEGTNPPYSFTCSIFVEYCMNQVGLYVPAPSKTQWAVLGAEKCSLDEAIKSLVPGDVVFFVGSPVLSNGQANPPPGHVGIYAGEGKFIHAAGHARGVVMDSLLQRSDFWGWGSITPLILEKMAEPPSTTVWQQAH